MTLRLLLDDVVEREEREEREGPPDSGLVGQSEGSRLEQVDEELSEVQWNAK